MSSTSAYQADGIRYWDALDPDLFTCWTSTRRPRALRSVSVADGSLARQPEIVDFLAG